MIEDYDNLGISVGAFSPYSSALWDDESGIYDDNFHMQKFFLFFDWQVILSLYTIRV